MSDNISTRAQAIKRIESIDPIELSWTGSFEDIPDRSPRTREEAGLVYNDIGSDDGGAQ